MKNEAKEIEETTIDEINIQREKAKEKVNNEYNDHRSPHYRDNERFRWAIGTINNSFDQQIEDLKSRL